MRGGSDETTKDPGRESWPRGASWHFESFGVKHEALRSSEDNSLERSRVDEGRESQRVGGKEMDDVKLSGRRTRWLRTPATLCTSVFSSSPFLIK